MSLRQLIIDQFGESPADADAFAADHPHAPDDRDAFPLYLLTRGLLSADTLASTQAELVAFFGDSKQDVSDQAKLPSFPRDPDGNFPIAAVALWRLLQRVQTADDPAAKRTAANADLAMAKARKTETEVAVMTGRLVSASDVALTVRKYIPEAQASLRDFYDSIGAMIDKDLDREGLIREFRKAIERAVDALAEMTREYNQRLERFQSHLDSRGITLVSFVDGLLDELEAAQK